MFDIVTNILLYFIKHAYKFQEMISYINKFHPRNYRVTYVPCSTFGCGNTPSNIQINVFAAMLDAQKDNPQAKLQLTCNRCGKTTIYTHNSIQKTIPANLRPTPLPRVRAQRPRRTWRASQGRAPKPRAA